MRPVEALILDLAGRGIDLWAEDGSLAYSAPEGALTDALLTELAARKTDLLAFLEQAHVGEPAPEAIPTVERGGVYPLSFVQRRLWFLHHVDPTNPRYNVPVRLALAGPLNEAALQRAIEAIVHRHEVLRTAFRTEAGEPVQAIRPLAPVPLSCLDLSELPRADRDSAAVGHLAEAARRPFDLERDLLLRPLLLRLEEADHRLLLVVHHLAIDGWSAGVLLRELTALYTAFATGQPNPLPPLPVQYLDAGLWQRKWLTGDRLQRQIVYWTDHLAGVPARLELPADRPRPAKPSGVAHEIPFDIEPAMAARLKAAARDVEGTFFTPLLAAYTVLLARYTGQDDLAIGAPVANRSRPELEGVIGPFANTLALRVDLRDDPTYADLLRRVRQVTLAAYEHQDLPFEVLVEHLHPSRDLSSNPIVQAAIAFQNVPVEAPVLPGLAVRVESPPLATARLDLEIFLWEAGDGLAGVMVGNADLFDAPTVERLARDFLRALRALVEDPQGRALAVPLMTADRQRALTGYRAAPVATELIYETIERMARERPDAVALDFPGDRYTYAGVIDRARRLAAVLREAGVGPESRVGVCLERSPDLVVALLSIWQAGGTYLPLDPSFPNERLAYLIRDSGARLLVGHASTAERIARLGTPVVRVDGDLSRPASVHPPASHPDSLAYVIYTSGSTGPPKGVGIPHAGVSNLVQAQAELFGLGPGDRVLQFSSLSFDASLFEIVLALSAGATLCLAPPERLQPGPPLLEYLRDAGITFAVLPPSALSVLPADPLPSLHTLTVAGESCPTDLVIRWAAGRRFFNLYGPTETTVWATAAHCVPGPGSPPIGRPVRDVEVYVLDRRGEPVPIGVPGELSIGGAGVGRGYLGRPALTAERFVPNPFGAGRLYRTGDRVKLRPDGELEFLGRFDLQVKVRGYRIELAEIEAELRALPAVAEAAVVVRETPAGPALAAWVVPASADPALDEAEFAASLRRALADRLPAYQVPATFGRLNSLPVTVAGKVDRVKLRDLLPPVPARSAALASLAPASPAERQVADLMAGLLGLPGVAPDDNFFDLGGHSLLVVALATRLEEHFGRAIALGDLLVDPTPAAIAVLLRTKSTESDGLPPDIVALRSDGTQPPLFLFPPAAGSPLGYLDLAQALAGERPVYGLQAPGLRHGERPVRTVEALAGRFITAIRDVQRGGPYHLAGWSFGGLTAYEAARRLTASGEEVAFLGLIDSFISPDGAHLPRGPRAGWAVAQATVDLAKQALTAGSYQELRLRARGAGITLPSTVPSLRPAPGTGRLWQDVLGQAARTLATLRASTVAGRAYRAGSYSGLVHLFRAGEKTDFERDAGFLALSRLVPRVQVVPVGGSHLGLILDPIQAAAFARHLTAVLQNPAAAPSGEQVHPSLEVTSWPR